MSAAYSIDKKRTVLYALRKEMGFSIREMAAELQLHPATYQGYESGSRTAPPSVVESARRSARKVAEFMAGIPARVDANLTGGVCPNAASPDWE